MMSDTRAANLAVVRRLCERWHEMSLAEFRDCIAADGVYINMPKPEQKRIGPEQAFAALEPWRRRCRIDLEIIQMQGDDDVVMAERLERFTSRPENLVIELYVVGVFEMKDGKIARWRDYYESNQAPSVLISL